MKVKIDYDLCTDDGHCSELCPEIFQFDDDHNKIMVVEGDLKIDGGRQAFQKIVNLSLKPTAIFAANDMMAMGILSASRKTKNRIPDDISLIGLDDTWLAAQMDPPLTTVALPNYQIGALAMETLFEILEHSEGDKQQIKKIVLTELVVRETTAPPK